MIRGSIGLLPHHEAAVWRYRSMLAKAETKPDLMQKMTEKYQERLLNYRLMMIARTETRGVLNHGQLDVWRQAANQGLVDGQSSRKVWVVDGDPCEICEPMDGIAVPLDAFWTLNTGDTVEVPTDSHPHCMCGMELEFGSSVEDEE